MAEMNNDLQSHSRTSEISQFDTAHISYITL